jgi:hypothetical protein
MAILIEQTSRDVPLQRTPIGPERTQVVVRPGDSFRFVDESGQAVRVPRLQVRRLDNSLIIDGFPGGQVVELNNFFGACRPGAECTVALEGLGAPPGTLITEETPPVSALADGSFLLYAAVPGESLAAAALPLAVAGQASGPSAGVIGALGGGLLLAAAAGAAGGGGGDDGPVVDTTPPAAPIVTSRGLSNDRTPVITGEAEAGARITLRIDLNGNGVFSDTVDATWSTVVDADGRWSVDLGSAPQFGALPPSGLLDNVEYGLLVQATDAAANVSPSTRTSITVDATPPAVPTIAIVETDDVVNAAERADGVTITGTAEAGSAVTVTWGATAIATTATAAGTYVATFAANQVPPDGLTSVQAVSADAAGNSSSQTRAVSIDATPPAAPTITSAAVTNLTRPVVGGFAEAGSTVTLVVDAANNGTADATYVTTATTAGTWSVDLATATPVAGSLGAGFVNGSTNGLSVRAVDAAANASAITAATVRIDTSIPSGPVIAAIEGDNIVNIAEAADGVIVSGTVGEAGRPVTVTWGAVSQTVTAVGTAWSASFAAGQVPPTGVSTLRASFVNAAGTTSAETTRDVTIDLVAPAGPTIGDNVSAATATGPITYTFTFAEPVTGFAAGDVQITNGTAGTFSGSGASYTLVVNPTPDSVGTVTVAVAAGSATDVAGNATTTTTSATQDFNVSVPPTLTSITDNAPGLASGPVTFTFNWSEPVTGFSLADIAVTGAGAGTLGALNGSGATYTLVYTPAAASSGTLGLSVGPGAVVDAQGNLSTGTVSVTQGYNTDTVSPTLVSITDPVVGVANGPVTFTFLWSEAVTGFTATDIVASGAGAGTFGALSGSGTTYTYTFTPAAGSTGNLGLSVGPGVVLDQNGNANTGTVATSQAYDLAAPTLTGISDNAPGAANGPVTFTFVFSEAVTGFDIADIVLGGAGAGTFSPLTGSGTTYALTFTPASGSNGTLTLGVGPGVVVDAAGNPNTGTVSTSQAYVDDSVAPTLLSITDPVSGPTNGTVTFTFNWSEPVTGFTLSDILVTGASGGAVLGGFTTVNASTYTASYSPAAGTAGTLGLSVANTAGQVTDLAGNPYTGTTSTTQVYDRVAPTITITDSIPGDTPTNQPVTFTFTTSEPVTDFTALDVNVSPGGTITTPFAQVTATTYTLTATPPPGDLASFTVSVGAGTFTDAAGNPNALGATRQQAYDTLPPTQTVTASSLLDNGPAPANAGPNVPILPGGTTTDATPRLTLTLSAVLGTGESVLLQRDGGTVATFTSGASLAYQEPAALGAGTYTYTASIRDSLGNTATLDLTPSVAGNGYVFTL